MQGVRSRKSGMRLCCSLGSRHQAGREWDYWTIMEIPMDWCEFDRHRQNRRIASSSFLSPKICWIVRRAVGDAQSKQLSEVDKPSQTDDHSVWCWNCGRIRFIYCWKLERKVHAEMCRVGELTAFVRYMPWLLWVYSKIAEKSELLWPVGLFSFRAVLPISLKPITQVWAILFMVSWQMVYNWNLYILSYIAPLQGNYQARAKRSVWNVIV